MGRQIEADYQGESIVMLSVLKGGFVFLADLMRSIHLNMEIGFLTLSSYQGETRPQSPVNEYHAPLPELQGRHVLLVEDILDSGASMQYALNRCAAEEPASLKTCVLLVKEDVIRITEPRVDYAGFHIPNEFVVGYGLDYQERYRNLPDICVLG